MYINHLDHISRFDELRESEELFLIMKYSPRCPLCLDKLGDLYKRISNSKIQNLWQINTVDEPEIESRIVEVTGVIHRTPQLLMIQHQKTLASRDENQISITEIEEKMREILL